ncbi:hypothetical protein OTU49_014648, partial [Cherax quadricarinatus]
ERSFVCFVNCTRRNVDMFWVNFQGKHIKHKTLARRERYKIVTYVTHPWVFRDSETSSALVVNSEETFYPKVVWSCLHDPQAVFSLEIPKVLMLTIAKWPNCGSLYRGNHN